MHASVLFWPDKSSGRYGNMYSIDLMWEKWKMTILLSQVKGGGGREKWGNR